VTRNGAVRLIDFDLAQPIPEKPVRLAKNAGTPGYMPPEQIRREPLDARADIYAFGVAAYELLTNQKPFPGVTPSEILAAQTDSAGPVAPRELNPDIPAGLESAILRCLHADPDRRYPTCGMLVRDLQHALYVS
jgi:serine/threonine-protein kinase